MPKRAQTGNAEATEALMLLVADRINQALASDPDLGGEGHGRIAKFARRYGLMRTTAHRILDGTTFPPYLVLMQVASDAGLPVDWFLGGGQFGKIEEEQQAKPVRIPLLGSNGACITMPRAEFAALRLPKNTTAVRLATDAGAIGSEGDVAFLQPRKQLEAKTVYLMVDHARQSQHIGTVATRGQRMTVNSEVGPAIVYGAADVFIGTRAKKGASGLQVLGAVLTVLRRSTSPSAIKQIPRSAEATSAYGSKGPRTTGVRRKVPPRAPSSTRRIRPAA